MQRLASGARLGSYQIVDVLGAGGMGVVYRARDTRLGRTVAIKIAGDLSADDHTRARLMREAQHASALNHPNICTIYEVGEADGTPFLVMEYVEGQPLNEVTAGHGLPVEKVIRFGIQIADAVSHAHDHGVVHRDLKPSNVVVTAEGVVKVLDFGLATRTWHEGGADASTVQLTAPGTIAGTVAYMAPEVLQGHPADAGSDIWSFGALLHELTTGTPPFEGKTQFEVSSRILREPPRPLPDDVPAGLANTISRCLLKDPRQRYQRACEVRAALQAGETDVRRVLPVRPHGVRRAGILAGAGLVTLLLTWLYVFNGQNLAIRSIAVVPFTNVGGNPDGEYLSDGITESVINSLAQLPQRNLKVIALNSVMRYKGRDVDPQSVGRDLAVRAVVIGRVAQRPGMLSVSAELVNVGDSSRLWGATYNAKVADVLTVQEEIATNISDNLRLRLDGQTKKRLTKRYTENVEAYQLYLKGRYVWNKYTEEGWTKAIEYFRQALDIDPGYALAWAGIADSHYQLSTLVLPPSTAIPRARAAATKALEIDESLGEAHASLGIIKAQYDWDRVGAQKELRRAVELSPNYATAHQWLGMFHFADGRFEDALAEFTQAQQLDPLSLMVAITAVWPLPHLNRLDEAVNQTQKVAEMFPDVPDVASYLHELRGDAYLRKGMRDEALTEFLHGFRTKTLTGDDAATLQILEDAYKTSGMNGYWRKQLELATPRYRMEVERANQASQRRYVSPYRLAELHARVGESDQAFALLQQCYDNRDETLVWLKAESLIPGSSWQHVRSDPRFTELLRRMGFES